MLELMVSMGIMFLISTMIAGNQSQYTSGASLKNIANDLGLSLRQAQVYGISVKEISPESNEFTAGYGVAFDLAEDDKSFIFFADRDRDGAYDDSWSCASGGESECLDKTVLLSGNYISDLCVIDDNENYSCGSDELSIIFLRPAIEARIYEGGGEIGSGEIGACVELGAVDGRKYSVEVYTTGQISVATDGCGAN